MDLQRSVVEKFMRYAAISSQSVGGCSVVPSSPGQTELGKLLMKELEELGLVDIWMSDTSVVYGRLPARLPEGHAPVPTVGWVAHLDTVFDGGEAALASVVQKIHIQAFFLACSLTALALAAMASWSPRYLLPVTFLSSSNS